ncbi:hypothetical protein LX32DRAFT_337411 [Colletotrichum zoysiae]|uniref:Uncharacterized protein n=1 Tax=Colletotrichum zoysiae TaxID=1216348 RepID=A0AAD9HKL0_9PEZI|nr:hypothetical protein LX32DRAFT_337411 [Colletotrichum zoysiae]
MTCCGSVSRKSVSFSLFVCPSVSYDLPWEAQGRFVFTVVMVLESTRLNARAVDLILGETTLGERLCFTYCKPQIRVLSLYRAYLDEHPKANRALGSGIGQTTHPLPWKRMFLQCSRNGRLERSVSTQHFTKKQSF